MQSVICQRCHKRPATSHLTELSAGGARSELHLCATCIQQLELRLEAGPPPITSMVAVPSAASVPAEALVEVASVNLDDCPFCGMSFADFDSGKRFGCAQDYTVWEDRLRPLLEGYHGNDHHIGRRPGAAIPADDAQRQRRLVLDTALRAAVSSEDFAMAAQLRDELRRLERLES